MAGDDYDNEMEIPFGIENEDFKDISDSRVIFVLGYEFSTFVAAVQTGRDFEIPLHHENVNRAIDFLQMTGFLSDRKINYQTKDWETPSGEERTMFIVDQNG